MDNLAKIIDVTCFQHKTFDKTDYPTVMHKHPGVEILYVINGTLQIEYTDAKGQLSFQFVYQREFVIIMPGVEHSVHFIVEKTSIQEIELLPSDKKKSLFDLILGAPVLADNKQLNNIIKSASSIIKLKDKADVSAILQQMILLLDTKYNGGAASSVMFDIDFTVLCYRLLASICHCKPLPESSMNNLHINHIITFIKNNYDKDITIKSMSSLLHLSPSYLQTLFKNEMDVNIVTYINNIRLEHAVSMMHDKTYDLKYIAQLCGFKTYRNFYNNFVKRYKIPPTEYLCLHDDEVFTVLVD